VRRRDRFLLIIAIAIVIVIATLVGAAGESLGLDRKQRANTVKTRPHSLFRQERDYIAGVKNDVVCRIQQLLMSLSSPAVLARFGESCGTAMMPRAWNTDYRNREFIISDAVLHSPSAPSHS
jgi:hypothetical protein